MLVLPLQRTLRDYANVVKAAEGFCTDVIHQLFNEARQWQDDIPYHLTVSLCLCAHNHMFVILNVTQVEYYNNYIENVSVHAAPFM